MNQIKAKQIAAILACLVLTGCMTRVRFEDGGITTNARLTAEYSVAADGAKTWKVDTMKQTVTLCREGKPEKLPAALEGKLGNLLKERWEKKFGKG